LLVLVLTPVLVNVSNWRAGPLDCAVRRGAVFGAQSVETAKSYLADAPNVTVVPVEINDGWARDWGPSVRLPHVRPCCVGVHAGGSGRPWAEHSGGSTNAITYHVGAHTAVLGMLGTHREHMHDHEVCRHVYSV